MVARRLVPTIVVSTLLAAGVGGVGSATGSQAAATGDWRVVAPASAAAIEGYTSEVSVAPGDTLRFHVSTRPAAGYRLEVYRIGWYDGAGAALVGCVPVSCTGARDGLPQDTPRPRDDTGELRAGWRVTDELVVPEDWRSGEYLAKLVLATGPDAGRSAGIPFVVRAPAGDAADVLVISPVNTWQAYNDWGGLSAYSDPRAAVKVSFDRPYAATLRKPYLGYPVVRFLDRFGWDVAFTTDVDVDRDRGQLARHRLVVVPGHSEYWSKELRDGLEAARGLGVSLAFLGGNTGYWQVRYADADRRVIELYRSASADPSPNPRQKTVRWRDAPLDRPECALLGNQWQGGDESSDPGPHPYVVTRVGARHPWLAGTGLRAGDAIAGAVGYEWDAVAPECGTLNARVTTLFHHEGITTPQRPGYYKSTFHSTDADAVTYTAPSGAVIFSAGSIDFGWTLAPVPASGDPAAGTTDPETPPDARMQRFARNLVDDLSSR